MLKKKLPSWLNAQKEELLEVLPRLFKDLGGPLSCSRFTKGSFLEELESIFKISGENEKAQKAFTEASLAHWPYNYRKPPGGWQEEGLEYSNDRDHKSKRLYVLFCLETRNERISCLLGQG